jgi:septal ring factor EnvC (AmiA/AmiB activator)
LVEHADDLECRLRSAEEKAAEDRIAADRKVNLAETRALEAERRAEAAEARAAETNHKAELLLGVIREELGGTVPVQFGRERVRTAS